MTRFLALVLTVLFVVGPAAHAEIIDRILAVVEGQLITLSDVRAVTRLGLESVSPGGDPIRVVLDRLIDRQLMLVEVDRYAPQEPAPEAIEARLNAVRARAPDALAFETTLGQVGMTWDHLRRYIRDSLRIESYLQQRFAAAIQPSDDEIAGYYRLHSEAFTRDGKLIPYADARNDAREALTEERRTALVRDWLAGLRRRAEVIDLYLTRPATAKPGLIGG